jgi:4-hydroxy-3-polyprenylbenzoate decarboxylase
MITDRPRRLVVGISGASGVALGLRVLDACRDLGLESHLIASRAAMLTLAQETDLTPADLVAKADVRYPPSQVGAAVASGSFHTMGMIIAPCSVRTFSEIATGVTSSLLTRAADVTLKERRPLVLMVRETPLHLGHLRSLAALAEMGAIIAPPLPAFYAKPASIAEMIDQSVGRALDLFGLEWRGVKRWGESLEAVGGEVA